MKKLTKFWGKSWLNKAVIIVLALLVWPITLAVLTVLLPILIIKKVKRPGLKWGLLAVVLLFGIFYDSAIIAGIVSPHKSAVKEATSQTPTHTPVLTQKPVQKPTDKPMPKPTVKPTQKLAPKKPSPTAVPKQTYDKTKGNNIVAAKYAQQFQDLADKAAPGAILDVYLELSPEMEGKSEAEYKKSVRSAFLTIIVDDYFWSTANDDSRKNLVAAYVNAVKNNFSGFPHVYFKNSVRTVAEGEWSVWDGEPKVKLK